MIEMIYLGVVPLVFVSTLMKLRQERVTNLLRLNDITLAFVVAAFWPLILALRIIMVIF